MALTADFVSTVAWWGDWLSCASRRVVQIACKELVTALPPCPGCPECVAWRHLNARCGRIAKFRRILTRRPKAERHCMTSWKILCGCQMPMSPEVLVLFHIHGIPVTINDCAGAAAFGLCCAYVWYIQRGEPAAFTPLA